MKVIRGDPYKQKKADAVCVLTNGYIGRAKQPGAISFSDMRLLFTGKKKRRAILTTASAKQAAERWPALPIRIAKILAMHGNHVNILVEKGKKYGGERLEYNLLRFPIQPTELPYDRQAVLPKYKGKENFKLIELEKKVKVKRKVKGSKKRRTVIRTKKYKVRLMPGYKCRATLEDIERSARELKHLALVRGWKKVIIPQPVTAAEGLSWVTVRKSLRKIWTSSRFVVVLNRRG